MLAKKAIDNKRFSCLLPKDCVSFFGHFTIKNFSTRKNMNSILTTLANAGLILFSHIKQDVNFRGSLTNSDSQLTLGLQKCSGTTRFISLSLFPSLSDWVEIYIYISVDVIYYKKDVCFLCVLSLIFMELYRSFSIEIAIRRANSLYFCLFSARHWNLKHTKKNRIRHVDLTWCLARERELRWTRVRWVSGTGFVEWYETVLVELSGISQ